MATHKSSAIEQMMATSSPVGAHTAASHAPASEAGTTPIAAHREKSHAAESVGLASTVAQLPLRFATTATGAAITPLSPLPMRAPASTTTKGASRPASVRRRFGELRAALADGWEIVQPIFARPLWSVADDSITAFNFVLRREHTKRLVTVPSGRTVQRFIRERQLLVDYRR
jgi:hypothetical protein